MKVKLNVKLFDLNKELIPKSDKNKEPMTAKDIIAEIVCGSYMDEKDLGYEEKLKRFKLAEKVTDSKAECDLSIEEIALIKKLAGKALTPLFIGQIDKLLPQ